MAKSINHIIKIIIVLMISFASAYSGKAQQINYVGYSRDMIENTYRTRFEKTDTTIRGRNFITVILKYTDSLFYAKSVAWSFKDNLCYHEMHSLYFVKKNKKFFKLLQSRMASQYSYNEKDNLYYYFVSNSIPIYISLLMKDEIIYITYYSSEKTIKLLHNKIADL